MLDYLLRYIEVKLLTSIDGLLWLLRNVKDGYSVVVALVLCLRWKTFLGTKMIDNFAKVSTGFETYANQNTPI